MRYALKDVRQNAKDLLALQTKEIQDAKKRKVAEGEIDREVAESGREAMTTAFLMLGLVTNEEAQAIYKKRWTNADIKAIESTKSWMCAESRLANDFRRVENGKKKGAK